MPTLPPEVHFWCEREEEYLQLLHKTCLELSEVYRKMYVMTSRVQNKLRLPAIIMSSLSGAVNFGSSSFASWSPNPESTQKYINIGVGLVNVFIAMIQTYESFRKIGDTVSKSISTSTALKKLADDIHCMVFIPAGDRETAGILYLRDAFNKYQSIMEQAPPLERATKDCLRFQEVSNKIVVEIRKQNSSITSTMSSPIMKKTPTVIQRDRSESSDSYISSDTRDKKTSKDESIIDIPESPVTNTFA